MPGPPLSLLDEHVRLALIAAAEALAAAPGAVYPLVYVAPLARPDALKRAASEAAAAFGIFCDDWTPDLTPRAPGILICGLDEIVAARNRIPERVQLIAWGSVPPAGLPPEVRDVVLATGNLVLELDPAGGIAGDAAWLGGCIGKTTSDRWEPLVVVAPRESLSLHADHALLLLESSDVESVVLTVPDRAAAGLEGVVAIWTEDAAGGAQAVAVLAAECRALRRPLVIVTDPASWDVLRTDTTWSTDGAFAVVRVGALVAEPAFGSLPWPLVPAVWIGGPPAADAEATVLPDGTTVLEGLEHLEVRRGAGQLVVWRTDAVAIVSVSSRAAGAVVVAAEVVGSGVAADRESVLHVLDVVRRWPGSRLAIVWGGGEAEQARVAEPVQRIGFHFSRLDDERARGSSPVSDPVRVRLHDVAHRLVGLGLRDSALCLLRQAERESRWGVDEEILLGFLVAGADPQEAITRLRHAALRLASGTGEGDSWARQTDTTLNALLLMVRTRQATAADAWATVSTWLEDAGTMWVASGRHAAVLFELAARAGRLGEARRFAAMFRAMAGEGDPLCAALEPVLEAVVGAGT